MGSFLRRSWWRCQETQSSLEILVCRLVIKLYQYLPICRTCFVVFSNAKGRTRPKTLSKPKRFASCVLGPAWPNTWTPNRNSAISVLFPPPGNCIEIIKVNISTNMYNIDKRNNMQKSRSLGNRASRCSNEPICDFGKLVITNWNLRLLTHLMWNFLHWNKTLKRLLNPWQIRIALLQRSSVRLLNTIRGISSVRPLRVSFVCPFVHSSVRPFFRSSARLA